MADNKTKAGAGIAAALALGLWVMVEGDGPKSGPDRYLSYQDVADVWTICNGHTGRDIGPNMVATGAMCQTWAAMDLEAAFMVEDRYIDHVESLPARVRAAVAVFIGNVGGSAFVGSSVRRYLNLNRIADACNALMLWNKAKRKGVLVAVVGLTNRRAAERKLCLGEA